MLKHLRVRFDLKACSSPHPFPSKGMDRPKQEVLYHQQSRTHYVSAPYASRISTDQRRWNELKVKALSAAVDRVTSSSFPVDVKHRTPLTLSSVEFDHYLLHHSVPDRGTAAATSTPLRALPSSVSRPPLGPVRKTASSEGTWGAASETEGDDSDFVNLILALHGTSGSLRNS